MLEGPAQQEHILGHMMWNTAVVGPIAVGKIADGTTYQSIVCRLVQHGSLRLMKDHQTNGNMMVKLDTFRQQKQVNKYYFMMRFEAC